MNVETWSSSLVTSITGTSASIEPRSYERGNIIAGQEVETTIILLQLSHVPMNVETPLASSADAGWVVLQLSHVPMNVETIAFE